jgi:surface polysaccharide O-acyltransferase-like enzyme
MSWAFPCFLCITGALLLKKEKQVTVPSALLRARRAILALLVFGVPFSVMMEYYESRKLSFHLLPSALVRVAGNRSFAHLWYLYLLVGIYLLLPAIKVFTDHAPPKLLLYVLLIQFGFLSVLPLVSRIVQIPIAFTLPVQSLWLFYLLAGHFIANCSTERKPGRGLYGAGVFLCGAAILLDCVCNPREPLVSGQYDSPVVAVLALCIFCLFLRIRTETTNALWSLDRLCFGVYLVHPVFIHLLYRVLKVTPTGSLYPLKTAGMVCLAAFVSFCTSKMMLTIRPVAKYIL